MRPAAHVEPTKNTRNTAPAASMPVAPKYPSVMGRMRAKKAPVETMAWAGSAAGSGRQVLTVPEAPPSQVTVIGEGAAAAPALVSVLRELGVVSR